MSTLHLVATPIGNLEDISARALRVLREVNLIAAEDTRHTARLLQHYGIHTPCLSYHEHNKLTRLDRVLAALDAGDVALVSDAGTPALNDPGYELVRAALTAGHNVSPIPGACAPVAALVASGLPTDTFLYLGYLPRRQVERRRVLQNIATLPHTLIFLETPHRLLEALSDLIDQIGDRSIAVARELTKLHEEIYRGKLSEAIAHFTTQSPRGEFTLVIAGYTASPARWSEEHLRGVLQKAQESPEKPAALARRLAAESGWPKGEVYEILKQLRSSE